MSAFDWFVAGFFSGLTLANIIWLVVAFRTPDAARRAAEGEVSE